MKASFFTTSRRVVSKSFKSLFRDKWTNIMTMMALVIVFLLINIASIFAFFSQSVINNVEQKVDIPVFFQLEVSDNQIRNFLSLLENKKINGDIKDYNYISREQALVEFEELYPGRMVFLRRYNIENPLSARVDILPIQNKTQDLINFLDNERLANIIDQEALKKNVFGKQQIENFVALASFTRSANIGILIFFMIASISLIFHAINTALQKHSEEMFIMKLVGANFSYIRAPFLLEGVLISIIAFALSLGITYGLFLAFFHNAKWFFVDSELKDAFVFHINKISNLFIMAAPVMAVVVLILALFGSYFAVQKHLRK